MSFKENLRNKDFVVTAELPLSPDSSGETIVTGAELLRDCTDGYLLTDNQFGRPHMSPMAAAGILLSNGFNPVMQLSCRNRNRIALLGDLLGARALGVDSLMLVRGSKVPEGYKPRPKAVMDIDTKELIATARLISEDEKLGFDWDFLIGASATVHDPAPNWQPEELLAKADAGAQMIITQLCFDTEILRRYMSFLVSRQLVRRVNVIVSIAVLQSAETAEWLRDNRRRAIVPDAVVERLATSSDPEQEGIEMCADIVREILDIPGVSGVHFAATGNLGEVASVMANVASS